MNRLLLTVAEAAEIAAVSRSQAYALIKSGIWPSVVVGSTLKVPVDELKEWINSQIIRRRDQGRSADRFPSALGVRPADRLR